MRCPQPAGHRGSLKWIQWAANQAAAFVDPLILAHLPTASTVKWLSPSQVDNFAEYRDRSFLVKVGAHHLAEPLAAFWPLRGPQWDALATTDRGHVLLFEAKAHIGELCSPPTSASGQSRDRILAALAVTASFCEAKPLAPWADAFYQLANRLAHLHFLRSNGVDAHLGLIDFVGDDDMNGPISSETWDSAYTIVNHIMGLRSRHPLSKFIFHVRPDVKRMQAVTDIAP